MKMAYPRHNRFFAKFTIPLFIIIWSASEAALPQVPLPPPVHDSVEVNVRLSAAEAEDGRLNEIYESTTQLNRKGDCSPAVIERYKREIIPAARKSLDSEAKNKFLFLANRDIGNCYLAQKKFADAEASFKEILQYASVWPGKNDSAYPIDFRQIATAQMGQEHWTEAEQSLLKSITIFENLITQRPDAIFIPAYRGSHARGQALLAVIYFRQGRTQDALNTVGSAYDEVTENHLPPNYRKEVEDIGKAIANASGDSASQKIWSQRGTSN